MIELFTIPKSQRCDNVRSHLKTWKIEFVESICDNPSDEINSQSDLLPVLRINDDYYNYISINTRDKLWKIVHEPPSPPPKAPRDEVDRVNAARAKKNKHYEPIITLSEEMAHRVTSAMENIVTTSNPVAVIELLTSEMSDDALYAFMIGWHLARHSDAIIWLKKSDEFKAIALTLDPYNQQQ